MNRDNSNLTNFFERMFRWWGYIHFVLAFVCILVGLPNRAIMASVVGLMFSLGSPYLAKICTF